MTGSGKNIMKCAILSAGMPRKLRCTSGSFSGLAKQRKAITPMYSTSRILKTMSENLHFIKLFVIAVLQKEFVVRASFHYPALVHYYDFVRFLHGT